MSWMRTPHLARIGYVSALCERPSSDELEELLSAWRQRNAEHGITGLLLYNSGSVFQVIEGFPEDVVRLYEAIARDPHFRELVSSRRRFVAIGSGVYSGYLLVFLALLGYAKDFMSTEVLGISLALWGGLSICALTVVMAGCEQKEAPRPTLPSASEKFDKKEVPNPGPGRSAAPN